MKLLATVFSVMAAGLFFGGCATDGSVGGYEDPDNLRTQERMQEEQSRITRQVY